MLRLVWMICPQWDLHRAQPAAWFSVACQESYELNQLCTNIELTRVNPITDTQVEMHQQWLKLPEDAASWSARRFDLNRVIQILLGYIERKKRNVKE